MKYYINKDYLLGAIAFQGKTVKGLCEELGCSRANFYLSINRAFNAPRGRFISKVIKTLDLEEKLVWEVE